MPRDGLILPGYCIKAWWINIARSSARERSPDFSHSEHQLPVINVEHFAISAMVLVIKNMIGSLSKR